MKTIPSNDLLHGNSHTKHDGIIRESSDRHKIERDDMSGGIPATKVAVSKNDKTPNGDADSDGDTIAKDVITA